SLMRSHGDENVSRWSYYDEFLKSRKIKQCREQYPEFEKVVVTKIKSGEISRAADIRDYLPKIAESGKKIIGGFVSGKLNFQDALDHASSGGIDKNYYIKINKFRTWLVTPEVMDDIIETIDPFSKKILYEFKKIKAGIEHLEKKMT